MRVSIVDQRFKEDPWTAMEVYCREWERVGHRDCPYREQVVMRAVDASEESRRKLGGNS